MTSKQRQEAVEKNMRLLGISYAEAEQIVADDETIDKGGRCEWEPTVEEEKQMRKNSKLKVERKKTERKPREKVQDQTKIDIINTVFDALTQLSDDLAIENPEKTIHFTINGENYSLNLTKHRK